MVRSCWRGELVRLISLLPKLHVLVSCFSLQPFCTAVGGQLANSTALCNNGTLYSSQLAKERKVQTASARALQSLIALTDLSVKRLFRVVERG